MIENSKIAVPWTLLAMPFVLPFTIYVAMSLLPKRNRGDKDNG
jgi:hypothetical protein